MYNAPLYPGIEDMLKSLSEAGVILYVVTSKPTFFAQRIVEHFGILPYFEKVIGPELGNIDYSKEELVKLALDDLRSDPKDCIMVGDRHFDIEGARANNIDSIGVLYGYGSEDELKEAGATFIARDAAEVRDLICVKEIWDAYDADHNVIEGVRLIRGEESKIPKGTYHLVCDILLRHKDGSYLLMQRDPRKTCPLMWEATAGGSALKGETPLMCAMRELKEETGISTGKMTEVRRSLDDGRHCLYVGFCCETDQDKESVTLQEGETVSFKWVSAEEILKMTKDELCTVRMRPFIR
jgi:8-oxo-dGTP pyrophosphatase MutT (NUDIX family)